MRRSLAVVLMLFIVACGGKEGRTPAGAEDAGKAAESSSGEVREEKPPAATAAGRVAVSGALFTHPLGFRFRYPSGWQLKPVADDILALVPPDVRRNEQGPTEVFLALGAPAGGATDPGAPSLVNQATALVTSNFPFLTRDGEVVRGRHGGRPSAALSFKGKSPTGGDYRATMWITLLEETALALTAICPADSFESRRPMVEAIFSTFHFREPDRDPALAGVWRNEDTYISGEFSATTVRYLGLATNGRATWGSKLSAGMSHSDSAGNFTGSSSGNSESGTSTGRWVGANRRLYIVWDSGSEEDYEYTIEGSSMLLTPKDGGKRKLWTRVR
jgi:hypothetical protein